MCPDGIYRVGFLPPVLLLIACGSTAPRPTATPRTGKITPPSPTLTPTVWGTVTPEAEAFAATLTLTASATRIRVGGTLQITASLQNKGWAMKGDTATFTLRAVHPGHVRLWASASVEVHEGYPGPAYWGSAGSRRLEIEVAP